MKSATGNGRLAARVRADNVAEQIVPELVALATNDADAWQIRAAVFKDPTLQNDSIALELVLYFERHYQQLSAIVARSVIEAAVIASAGSTDAGLLCIICKHRATALSAVARFDDASSALAKAAEFAAVARDPIFHGAGVQFGRAALAYKRRCFDEAADRLHGVIAAYEQLGAFGDAAAARALLNSVNFRRGTCDSEELLAGALAEGDSARAAGDQVALARALARTGGLLLKLRRMDEARAALDSSIAVCRAHNMVIIEAQAARLRAELVIQVDGVAAGLCEIRRVRARFSQLGMPAEATITLIDAVEVIIEIDASSPEIVPLLRRIHAEAAKLDLPIAAATALDHLLHAAMHHEPLTHQILGSVRDLIPPSAQLIEANVTN